MNTPPPYTPPQLIDPLFVGKTEEMILSEFIDRELTATGFDTKNDSLAHFEKTKMTATLISAPINLIIIVLFRTFHYGDFFAGVLVIINFLIWRKFQKADVKAFFSKEIKARPSEKFSDVIAPHLYDKCKNHKWLRLLILVGCTFLLPALLFLKPHTFYEDAPDGKYVRFYTEGLIGGETLVIPDEIDGIPVKGIRGDVFNSTDLVSVTLPNSIDTLRGHAFEYCHSLREINLPKNLKYIGGHAFAHCGNLGHLDFPPTLRFIGGYAFDGCRRLTISSLPSEMDSIGAYAFQECSDIEEIILPKNLTEIRAYTFSGSGLKKIVIPASVQRIGEQAFSSCYYLEELLFEEGSQLQRIGSRAFFDTKLTEVVIPPSVKEIRGSAFRDCEYLQTAKIPKGCTLADKVFKNSPTKVEEYDIDNGELIIDN